MSETEAPKYFHAFPAAGTSVFNAGAFNPVILSFSALVKRLAENEVVVNTSHHLSPAQARAIAADLVRAADFVEGKVAP